MCDLFWFCSKVGGWVFLVLVVVGIWSSMEVLVRLFRCIDMVWVGIVVCFILVSWLVLLIWFI